MFSIKLNKLKGIKELQFTVPEQNNVYLITGPNGCGKTILRFGCLSETILRTMHSI